MESLQIRTGVVKLQILDDEGNERGIFTFNPDDVQSAENIIKAEADYQKVAKDIQERTDACKTAEEKFEVMKDGCNYIKQLIDNCFGEGSSELLFGDAMSLSMFVDFFEGITPYYAEASKKRVAKYAKPAKITKTKKS